MDTRFIQTLLSVVDSGSFSATARTENMTPAAVAQRIRSLEAELGETLIVRAGQQVRATSECLSILDRLRHIASEVRQIAADIDTNGLGGSIRLGAISTVLSDRIPNILAQFAQQSPSANLSIVPGTSNELYSKILNEEIDVAILIKPPFKIPKTIKLIPFEIQSFVLIVSDRDQRPVDEIISSERALIYDSNSWGGRLVMSWIEKQIPPERVICEMDALEAIAVTVSQGVGFSIIPHWRGLAKMGPLRCIPLPEITHMRELVLLHRHQSPECLELLQS